MAVKLTSPLFSATAKGTIPSIGTFRTRAGVTTLTHKKMGLLNNNNGKAALKNCFATAKQLHAQITPGWVWIDGGYHFVRTPLWPAYWTQYLIDNPGCTA